MKMFLMKNVPENFWRLPLMGVVAVEEAVAESGKALINRRYIDEMPSLHNPGKLLRKRTLTFIYKEMQRDIELSFWWI